VSDAATPQAIGAQLEALLPEWLPRQRWYSGSAAPSELELLDLDVLLEGEAASGPALLSLIVRADGVDWHVPVGLRSLEEVPPSVADREGTVIGRVALPDGQEMVAFDAAPDQELAAHFHCRVTGSKEAPGHIRPIGAEQSNTSLVSDDTMVIKLFRRLVPGANPDVQVPSALSAAGFAGVPAVHGVWRRGEYDLAVAQSYLPGSSDGFALALASLRESLGSGLPPQASGGDFGAEAFRLGQITGELHVALAEAFGQEHGQPKQWAADLAADLDRARIETARAAELIERLEAVESPGAAIRGHGDYHLGQVLRADAGWFVLDFEGEPARSAAERARLTSPLRDVAGMLRSFEYVAAVALREQVEDDRDRLEPLAAAWVSHNTDSLERGYASADGVEKLLPSVADRAVILVAFSLEKAAYELAYERAHRPDWEDIPARAIERLLATGRA
jgi:maltokinase